MAIAINPARTGSMKPNAAPPIDLNSAATGVIVPKLLRSASDSAFISTLSPSIRNAMAIRIPPPTTKGNICDTPFISCVYILCPIPPPFFADVLSFFSEVPALYTGASPARAFFISSSALLIPSET